MSVELIFLFIYDICPKGVIGVFGCFYIDLDSFRVELKFK